MTIHPIDAQVMMLNQATVGKEQQLIKDQPLAIINADIENIAKESKENEKKVLTSHESEKKKIDEREKKNESDKKKNKKKRDAQDENAELKEMQHQIDPVRGHSLDITL